MKFNPFLPIKCSRLGYFYFYTVLNIQINNVSKAFLDGFKPWDQNMTKNIPIHIRFTLFFFVFLVSSCLHDDFHNLLDKWYKRNKVNTYHSSFNYSHLDKRTGEKFLTVNKRWIRMDDEINTFLSKWQISGILLLPLEV